VAQSCDRMSSPMRPPPDSQVAVLAPIVTHPVPASGKGEPPQTPEQEIGSAGLPLHFAGSLEVAA